MKCEVKEGVVSAKVGFTLWQYMGIPRLGSQSTESGDVFF